MQSSGGTIIMVAHILAVSFIGFATVMAAQYRRHRKLQAKQLMTAGGDKSYIPHLNRTESGRIGRLERFSHYVARQMGFEDPSECEEMCKLAMKYLKRTEGCEDDIFAFFGNGPETENLSVKLLEEFERCILSYFSFHWSQAADMVTQVLSAESQQTGKLKKIVLEATRKQRFERVTKNLKVTRVFSTLVEEMKVTKYTDVMAAVDHSERSPVLLLMGGGMGAGKSTVLKDIMKQTFWVSAKEKAVVVEADAFKESDVIYQALKSKGRHEDMLQTAELVHQSSTDAASSLLVTALNEGRDVIMDGTLSWVPFVEQTIAMARNIHKHQYRMGVGYKVAEDGTVTENYWEQVPEEEVNQEEKVQRAKMKPYKIELVGVVCDAYLAVVRGIRRAVIVERAVRVKSQLKSHKMFASAFKGYCPLVDDVRLYCTNTVGAPLKLIARKEGNSNLLVDPDEIKCLTTVTNLNPDADSIDELYSDPSPIYEPGSVWKDVLLAPSRPSIQLELKHAIKTIERQKN